MTMTRVIRGARRVDPVDRIDDTVDLLIADGIVDRVGRDGAADDWITEHTEVIDAAGAIVCPGLVDLHTHVFGAAGVSDDTPLARWYASLRSLRIADGPDEVHLMGIARRELRRART